MQIVWLDQALLDLDEHIEYISLHNPTAASEQDLLTHRAVERLVEYPNLGKAGRLTYTRELVIPRTPFIALYRIMPDRDEVHILRILHSSQKWPPE
jgi:toxin ParE1/3/4